VSRLGFIKEWNSMRQNNDEFVRKFKHEQKMKASLEKIAKENEQNNNKANGNENEESKIDKKNELSPNKQENNFGLKPNVLNNHSAQSQSCNRSDINLNINNHKINKKYTNNSNESSENTFRI